MLKIGICDDDSTQIEQIHSWIDEELFQRTELSIVHFSSGEEVVAAIEQERFDIHLLFMDINMKELNGMQTAAYIRRQQVDVDIIFLTVSRQNVYNGYIHKAFAYLLKPVQEKMFKRVLNKYVDEWEQGSGYLEISTFGGQQKIWLDKVLYFTSDVRVVDAHLLNDTIRFYGKLDDIEQQIPDAEFLRCHQSFLVNKKMIEKMTREYLVVRGEHIPISRYRYEQMKKNGMFSKGGKIQTVSENKMLARKWDKVGAIIGVEGKYIGAIIRIQPNQKIVFGRNHEMCDFVLDDIEISRRHCWIQYNQMINKYYVCDQSTNGVLINETYCLEKDRVVELNSGDELRFADTENIFKLG